MAHPLKNHSNFSKTALWPQKFPRLRRAKRRFAFGTVLHSPESATLAVTITPVSPEGESPPRERRYPLRVNGAGRGASEAISLLASRAAARPGSFPLPVPSDGEGGSPGLPPFNSKAPLSQEGLTGHWCKHIMFAPRARGVSTLRAS